MLISDKKVLRFNMTPLAFGTVAPKVAPTASMKQDSYIKNINKELINDEQSEFEDDIEIKAKRNVKKSVAQGVSTSNVASTVLAVVVPLAVAGLGVLWVKNKNLPEINREAIAYKPTYVLTSSSKQDTLGSYNNEVLTRPVEVKNKTENNKLLQIWAGITATLTALKLAQKAKAEAEDEAAKAKLQAEINQREQKLADLQNELDKLKQAKLDKERIKTKQDSTMAKIRTDVNTELSICSLPVKGNVITDINQLINHYATKLVDALEDNTDNTTKKANAQQQYDDAATKLDNAKNQESGLLAEKRDLEKAKNDLEVEISNKGSAITANNITINENKAQISANTLDLKSVEEKLNTLSETNLDESLKQLQAKQEEYNEKAEKLKAQIEKQKAAQNALEKARSLDLSEFKDEETGVFSIKKFENHIETLPKDNADFKDIMEGFKSSISIICEQYKSKMDKMEQQELELEKIKKEQAKLIEKKEKIENKDIISNINKILKDIYASCPGEPKVEFPYHFTMKKSFFEEESFAGVINDHDNPIKKLQDVFSDLYSPQKSYDLGEISKIEKRVDLSGCVRDIDRKKKYLKAFNQGDFCPQKFSDEEIDKLQEDNLDVMLAASMRNKLKHYFKPIVDALDTNDGKSQFAEIEKEVKEYSETCSSIKDVEDKLALQEESVQNNKKELEKDRNSLAKELPSKYDTYLSARDRDKKDELEDSEIKLQELNENISKNEELIHEQEDVKNKISELEEKRDEYRNHNEYLENYNRVLQSENTKLKNKKKSLETKKKEKEVEIAKKQSEIDFLGIPILENVKIRADLALFSAETELAYSKKDINKAKKDLGKMGQWRRDYSEAEVEKSNAEKEIAKLEKKIKSLESKINKLEKN